MMVGGGTARAAGRGVVQILSCREEKKTPVDPIVGGSLPTNSSSDADDVGCGDVGAAALTAGAHPARGVGKLKRGGSLIPLVLVSDTTKKMRVLEALVEDLLQRSEKRYVRCVRVSCARAVWFICSRWC